MDAELATHSSVAALATAQHGVVARAQLQRIGVDRGSVEKRIATGELHRIHRGVYAVGHPVLARVGVLMAGVLACGDGAVLSYRSAAELWRMRPPARWIDVTVPGTRRGRRGWLLVHRAPLPAEHVTTIRGIPVTTPARTLIDLADVLDRRGVERALDEGDYLRLDFTGLVPVRGRAGYGILTRILAEHEPGSTRTRSGLEERMLLLCDEVGLPRPEVNVRVEGHTVDFLWRAARLVVETDGRAAHTTRAAFERDRRRDADLVAAGWRVIRVTLARLYREPAEVAALLSAVLALPSAAAGS